MLLRLHAFAFEKKPFYLPLLVRAIASEVNWQCQQNESIFRQTAIATRRGSKNARQSTRELGAVYGHLISFHCADSAVRVFCR